jgi:hypothetical protein
MLRRRERFRFFREDRGLQRAYGTAAAMASARNPERAQGADSLDLLIAATDARPVAKLLRRLDLDRDATVRRANAARIVIDDPGLTPDARRVIEAVTHRALEQQRNPTPVDLFVALAGTPGPAHEVLLDLGLDEARLAALVE